MKVLLCLWLFAAGAVAENPSAVWECEDQWVISLAVSHDGKWLASGSDDGTLRVWDLAKKSPKGRVLKVFSGPVTALVFGSNETVIAGAWDGTLGACDFRKGEIVTKYEEHQETITTLDVSPDGKYLASGSADDRLIVWDMRTGEDLLTMHQGNEYDVTTLAFSPDGETVATGDGENQIKLWDAGTGEEISTLKGHDKPVSAVIYDSKGRLISGSWDATIRIHDDRAEVMKGHKAEITGLVISSDGKKLFSASEDNTVRAWNLESTKNIGVYKGTGKSLRCLEVTGERIFAGTKDGIVVWESE